MTAGAPIGNKNAETWTFEEAEKLFKKAVELSESPEYDFIGEVAKAMGTYHKVFDYLSDKYPVLKNMHEKIISNCETNCFSNSKKGNIREATAIVNLKSNHGWTDRSENNVNVKGNISGIRFESDEVSQPETQQ